MISPIIIIIRDWGWEEHRDAGGIVLQNAHFNRLHQNRTVDVWSAWY